jgi:hypothetical protein
MNPKFLFLGLLILAVCFISLTPIIYKEGYYSSYGNYYKELDEDVIQSALDSQSGIKKDVKGNAKGSGSSFRGWDNKFVKDYDTPLVNGGGTPGRDPTILDDIAWEIKNNSLVFDKEVWKTTNVPMGTNVEYLRTINRVLLMEPDEKRDLSAIYAIESLLAGIKKDNARYLLYQLGYIVDAEKPRNVLKYMKWYGTSCPIDADACIDAR